MNLVPSAQNVGESYVQKMELLLFTKITTQMTTFLTRCLLTLSPWMYLPDFIAVLIVYLMQFVGAGLNIGA